MTRSLLIALLIFFGTPSLAQRDSSLTEEFGKLSAKQRTKIAMQEEKDAADDAEYQALMRTAETHFKDRLYDDALKVYEQARKRRPYNVHPKVKIQDLEAFIKERDRKAGEKKSEQEPAVANLPAKEKEVIFPVETPRSPEPVKPIVTKDRGSAAPSQIAKRPIDERPRAIEIERPTPEPIAGERIYKEAGSLVIERVVSEEGRLVIYKKVIQRWGGTVHFRNGQVITPRVWEEAFGD